MGWHRITCEEREALIDRVGRSGTGPVEPWRPVSALTDLNGRFGDPVSFTEWGDPETGRMLLRDRRWPGSERICEHHEWRDGEGE